MTAVPRPKFLVVLDVDSTLIQDEVIELLAEEAGKRDEVAEITHEAMSGSIEFSESLRKRVATLRGLPSSVIERTVARVRPTPGATRLIDAVHERGGIAAAVSGGFIQVLDPLAARLKLDRWRANELGLRDGVLTGEVVGGIVDGAVKARSLVEWSTDAGIPIERTVAIGDGANDLLMMGVAGLSIAFRGKPSVRAAADVRIDENDLAIAIPFLPNV